MAHSLTTEATFAFVGFCSVDGVQIIPKSNFGCSHLGNHGAQRPVDPVVALQAFLTGLHTEAEKSSAVLGRRPFRLPLGSHCFANRCLSGCHQDVHGVWFWRCLVSLRA